MFVGLRVVAFLESHCRQLSCLLRETITHNTQTLLAAAAVLLATTVHCGRFISIHLRLARTSAWLHKLFGGDDDNDNPTTATLTVLWMHT